MTTSISNTFVAFLDRTRTSIFLSIYLLQSTFSCQSSSCSPSASDRFLLAFAAPAMSDHRHELYDPSPNPSSHPTEDPSYSFSAVPLSPGLPSHPIAPDQQAYLPTPVIRRRPSLQSKERYNSFLDEILPTPSTASANAPGGGLLRRTGAVGVIVVFILVATWLAATDSGGQVLGAGSGGLRNVFWSEGEKEWSVQAVMPSPEAGKEVAVDAALAGVEEEESVMPGELVTRYSLERSAYR